MAPIKDRAASARCTTIGSNRTFIFADMQLSIRRRIAVTITPGMYPSRRGWMQEWPRIGRSMV